MKKVKMNAYFLLILAVIVFCSKNLFAVPANPYPAEITQPDGTKIFITAKGDEFYNWNETADGYTVIKDTHTKFWTYAQKENSGRLVSSGYPAGKRLPLGLTKSLKDDVKMTGASKKIQEFNSSLSKTYAGVQKISAATPDLNKTVAAKGTRTNLVVLVQFSDLKFQDSRPFNASSTETQIRDEFYKLFNTAGYTQDGAVGSVKDFFSEISYGQLTMNSVITPIVTLDYSYRQYGEGGTTKDSRDMVLEALAKLEAGGYNFKSVWPSSDEPEGLTFIHAGGGAEYSGNDPYYIWSHQWQLQTPVTYDGITFSLYHTEPARRGWDDLLSTQGLTRIGVLCHESMHFFGMPDLYDYTYTSAGLGKFCLMAGGSWNGTSSSNAGNSPAHPSAWIKYKLEWIIPQTPSEGINTIGTSATSSSAYYKLAGDWIDSKEYFLMENRQRVGFDSYLPGTTRGILIYHVDENKNSNNDRTHYLVDLEEADGTAVWVNDHLANYINEGLDSDYYRAGTVTSFNDNCTLSPDSKSYAYQSSKIDISGISASAATMSFVAAGIPDYVSFIDALNDLKGLKIVNIIMKYSPEKTKEQLKLLGIDQQTIMSKYFTFTSAGALEADNMYDIYYAHQNNLPIYGISKTQTGLVYPAQANLISKLNYNLSDSGQSIASVGNVSDGNNPLELQNTGFLPVQKVDYFSVNKRFTGTQAVANIEIYEQNLGYLLYKFANMNAGEGYDIIEVTSPMNI